MNLQRASQKREKGRFLQWIASVESEYHAARLAVTKLREEARSDSKNLTSAGLLLADVKKCLSNLEATYIVRLFAEFESALRIYWKVARKRKSSPQISSLIRIRSSFPRNPGCNRNLCPRSA